MSTDKPYETAVALRYDQQRADAPQVVASGRGAVAARIVEAGRAGGVPVLADPDLMELLARVPIGTEIPPELYQAVAAILAFVYRIDCRQHTP